ncbi:M20 family metallopeptidase [Acidianus sp. HS-5]|uniref:M20 family metallopeptidase n=1 Tax=Acidianus sp. HS-5 TaxID=2886040 RepID=UPI001F3D3529|nr:M20 family metallopeptidase [Acidianus sp. HS-5]BDC18548.1 succinyl-diaminopimelate desuccinylase [Acidianus sp. HS-5]
MEELIKKLISFKTYGGNQLYECASFIKEYLENHGFKAEIKEYVKGYPIVLSSSGKGKPLMLNGHFDVVPPGEGWSSDPFTPKAIEDKIYGRGSTDMKAGLAVLMETYVSIADKLNYSLLFTAVPDEETGGKNGSKFLAEEYSPFFVIIGEPTGSERVNIGEKGLLQVRVKERGKSAHGSTPSLGENAILKLVDDITELRRRIEKTEVAIPKDVEEAVNNVKEIDERIYGDVKKITFSPGVIKGGSQVNVVPDYAEAEIDMRIPPGASVKDIMKRMEGIEIINSSEPNYTPLPPFIKLKPFITPYATDGRYFRMKGIPTIVYGPGELNKLHSPDEFVKIGDVKASLEKLKEILLSINNSDYFYK